MNMQSLEPGQVPESPRQPALSVLAAAAQLVAGTVRRMGWLSRRALKLALPQSAGPQVV